MTTTSITVAQLNRYVKAKLEEDGVLKDLLLVGEISNLKDHYRSGHLYFVLKDSESAVRAVMFRSNAQRLHFSPADGMRVTARCTVSLYERDGSYQIYVRELIPDGAGALYLAYEKLKARLEAEGLFEERHKRPLPPYPQTVGVVTSQSGAALQDILQILARRWPFCRVVLSPSAVQGQQASGELCRALESLLQGGGCDVIILGRGGGSIEDLWAFNDEALARLVYAAGVPVVSAVGHETDFTICDFVADLRAATPSAAAELVTPDAKDVYYQTAACQNRAFELLLGRLKNGRDRLDAARLKARLFSPRQYLINAKERLDETTARAQRETRRTLQSAHERLVSLSRLAHSLSPTGVMLRGYGVFMKNERAVRSVEELKKGETLTARFFDGEADLRVERTREAKGGF